MTDMIERYYVRHQATTSGRLVAACARLEGAYAAAHTIGVAAREAGWKAEPISVVVAERIALDAHIEKCVIQAILSARSPQPRWSRVWLRLAERSEELRQIVMVLPLHAPEWPMEWDVTHRKWMYVP